MLLERVRIQHYKCLRDVSAEFSNPAAGERTFFPHLLVGVNGSGKSCFLEALGLIFTRMMQGEAPGFPFVLEYRIRQAQIRVRPAGKDAPPDRKLEVTVTSDGGTRQLERVPEEYLPRRIVACSSGSNHLMESVLLSSPRESLSSGLYDLAGREDPDTEREMARLLEQYRALDTNPRVFSIDGKRPGWWRRCSLPLSPTFLTGRWPRATLSEARRNSPQYGLLAKLFRAEQPDGSGPLHSWMVRRAILPPEGDSGGEDERRMSQTVVFCYEPWLGREDGGWQWNRRLSVEIDGDHKQLLNVLIAAHRSGILRDVQMAFHCGEEQALLGLETLSEGELMWLARMGLVLMSRLSGSAETLFLFDEPDVHFNSEWNMDFIRTLGRCSETPEGALRPGVVIATHSTLLLTDVYPEQINLFSALEGGGIQVERTPVSPFAAQQDELARLLFSASAVGSYALQQVDSLLARAQTPEEVLELIRQTGPGYQRFRLYERYHELKREQG